MAPPLVAEIPYPQPYAAHLTATDDRLRNADQLRYALWETKSNSAQFFGDCVSGKLRETSPQDQSEFGKSARHPDRQTAGKSQINEAF